MLTKDKQQADNGAPKKAGTVAVRLFFVDNKTGNPVAGVVVSISMHSAGAQGRNLATLQTDKAGYVKFDGSLLAAGSQVEISYQAQHCDPLILNVADLFAGAPRTIHVEAVALDANASSLGLPSVMSPDIIDLNLSPGSIGLTPQLYPPPGLCRQLMPTTLTVQCLSGKLLSPMNHL